LGTPSRSHRYSEVGGAGELVAAAVQAAVDARADRRQLDRQRGVLARRQRDLRRAGAAHLGAELAGRDHADVDRRGAVDRHGDRGRQRQVDRAASGRRGGRVGVAVAVQHVELELIDRRHRRRLDAQRDARAGDVGARIVGAAAPGQRRRGDQPPHGRHPSASQWIGGSVAGSSSADSTIAVVAIAAVPATAATPPAAVQRRPRAGRRSATSARRPMAPAPCASRGAADDRPAACARALSARVTGVVPTTTPSSRSSA
jgi:hypothetical protein